LLENKETTIHGSFFVRQQLVWWFLCLNHIWCFFFVRQHLMLQFIILICSNNSRQNKKSTAVLLKLFPKPSIGIYGTYEKILFMLLCLVTNLSHGKRDMVNKLKVCESNLSNIPVKRHGSEFGKQGFHNLPCKQLFLA